VSGKHAKHKIKVTKVWKNEFLNSIEKIKENYTKELKEKIVSKKKLLKKLEIEEKKFMICNLQFQKYL
jgi:putative sterol carrier protein